jgi:hypothetical protein
MPCSSVQPAQQGVGGRALPVGNLRARHGGPVAFAEPFDLAAQVVLSVGPGA